ncbi:unnamed protein product [Vicia faba]|uniref:Uncharacterized protein n=1 Tax=Vicia faba TaxID=3906 RepID=A0AAV1B3C9_VICFA|nr:unnamed protein product [Vicia faba]
MAGTHATSANERIDELAQQMSIVLSRLDDIVPGLLPTPLQKPRFRHLLEPELAEKREKGICFNCDQKWSRQHRCSGKVFLMVAEHAEDEGDAEQIEMINDMETPLEESRSAQLSLHALAGSQVTDTFRVLGRILENLVRILVDGGSTHNFIQSSIPAKLGLPQSQLQP